MPRPVDLSDDARFPLIPEDRRGLLGRLRQHPHAPAWNFACGDRLDAAGMAQLRAWEAGLRAGPSAWGPGERPGWLDAFAARARASVPFYRQRGAPDAPWEAIPTFRRADLAAAPWAFVPDDQPLDALLVYPTSGTTGPPFEVYSHPVAANAWLPFIQRALGRLGRSLEGGPGRVSLATVHAQRGTYTYPSLMSWLDGAGFVKVNLDPSQWRAPGDAVAFLQDCDPELIAADPYALSVLAALPVRLRPKALVSAATALSPGLRRLLAERFQAPVLDVWSMTEARLLAVDLGEGHEILAHDTYVEILDPQEDRPVPPGARGEIVVSGGHNPFLPLLRYRTGDFARLEHAQGRVFLREPQGRRPVCLLDAAGEVVNTIDVARALGPLALARFQLHQARDRALTLRYDGPVEASRVRLAVEPLFAGIPLTVESGLQPSAPGEKVTEFVSEVEAPVHAEVFAG